MGKRKSGAVQFEDDGSHRSKKPRADSTQPTADEDERAQQSSIDATEDPPVERETKEPRAARKLAKRLAKRERRHDKGKDDRAQSNESRDDAATIPIQPVEIVDVVGKSKKEPRKRLSDAGDVPKPGRSSKTKQEKRISKAERLRLEKFGPDAIRITKDAKENKIVSNNFQGRGEILRQKPDEWYFSKQIGGRMRDIDPLFSTNEEWVQRLVIGAPPLLTGL
ncbi:MAG: hypothetical protein L6R42_007127 [Xanthoria sp. 1 TBL-2021]|nr:MAG: hypothetical protein L6R42_007127 [Xanthoria sp. 1 TBL-2021]